MEIPVAGELLADQRRSDHLATLLDHAALRLIGEDNARNPRHHQWIDEAGKDRQREDEHDRRAIVFILALTIRSEEHTSELQSLRHLVCRLLLEKKKNIENKR